MQDIRNFARSLVPGLKHSIKTAIAAVACLYLTKWLNLPQGFWAAVSAIIVMQSNVGATLSASRSRLIGTAIGAVVAGLFVQFVGTSALAFGIAVVLVVLICDLSGLQDSYRLAGVTVAIVMLINRLGPTWLVAGERFLQVALGIVVGVLVSLFIWPAHARESLRNGIAEAITAMGALFQSVSQREHGGDSSAIDVNRSRVNDILRRSDDLHVQAAHERAATGDAQLVAVLMDHAARLLEALEGLEISGRACFEGTYHLNFKPETDELEGEISEALNQLARSTGEWRFDAPWPDFGPVLTKIENKVSQMRASGASPNYPLEEVLQFYAFLYSLKNLANELNHTHAASSRMARTASPD